MNEEEKIYSEETNIYGAKILCKKLQNINSIYIDAKYIESLFGEFPFVLQQIDEYTENNFIFDKNNYDVIDLGDNQKSIFFKDYLEYGNQYYHDFHITFHYKYGIISKCSITYKQKIKYINFLLSKDTTVIQIVPVGTELKEIKIDENLIKKVVTQKYVLPQIIWEKNSLDTNDIKIKYKEIQDEIIKVPDYDMEILNIKIEQSGTLDYYENVITKTKKIDYIKELSIKNGEKIVPNKQKKSLTKFQITIILGAAIIAVVAIMAIKTILKQKKLTEQLQQDEDKVL